MGGINGNKEAIKHDKAALLWGDNEFETATLKITAGEEAKDGAILVRDTDGTLKVATDADAPAFVLVDRETFSTAGSYPVRVAISGKFNRAGLTLSGAALTDAQADALRGYGIIAVKAVGYGSSDNE